MNWKGKVHQVWIEEMKEWVSDYSRCLGCYYCQRELSDRKRFGGFREVPRERGRRGRGKYIPGL